LYLRRKHEKTMALRFRKHIKILPGIWLNLSKSGISTSIGGKGLTVNIKDGKTRTTVGLPGTGISYTETSSQQHVPSNVTTPERLGISAWFWLLLIVVVGVVVMLVR
jgi:L,D-peptidoglycan transpeptidase YkuD (ErfK/YbiS/YcfS/YnhG family)